MTTTPPMPDDQSPPQPGTLEYAAAAKHMFSERLARIHSGMPGGDDLLVVIYGCAYDNDQGLCVGVDGDPTLLVNTMAAAILEIADTVQALIMKKEQFLPRAQQTPYHRIVADVTGQLLQTIKMMQREKKVDPGIIL